MLEYIFTYRRSPASSSALAAGTTSLRACVRTSKSAAAALMEAAQLKPAALEREVIPKFVLSYRRIPTKE